MSNRRKSGRNKTAGWIQNEFGALLEELRENKSEFTQQAIGDYAGVTKTAISDYESGKSFPGEAVAQRISDKLECPELMETWRKVSEQRKKEKSQRKLTKGKPQKKKEKDAKPQSGEKQQSPPEIIIKIFESLPRNEQNWILDQLGKLHNRGRLKLIMSGAEALQSESTATLVGEIAAGMPIEPIPDSEFREIPIPKRWKRGKVQIFALRVVGNSMKDESIFNGDIVFIRENKQPASGQIVAAYVNGGATLKRWFLSRNKVVLHPANPEMSDSEISRRAVTLGRQQIECFGEMIGLLREFPQPTKGGPYAGTDYVDHLESNEGNGTDGKR